jgi:hypothetical protein
MHARTPLLGQFLFELSSEPNGRCEACVGHYMSSTHIACRDWQLSLRANFTARLLAERVAKFGVYALGLEH